MGWAAYGAYSRDLALGYCQASHYMLSTFKADKTTVSGNKTLEKTTEYPNKIVHGWVDPIDSGCLEDIVQTINELLRKKYF